MRTDRKTWLLTQLMSLTLLALGLSSVATAQDKNTDAKMPDAAKTDRVFELRTYTIHPGKMPDMLKRFRDHTTKLFEKHGMENIGYWVSEPKPDEEPKLIYIVAHKSRAAATASWDAFRKDPDWIAARDESEKAGKIVAKVESVFLSPTDFSKLK